MLAEPAAAAAAPVAAVRSGQVYVLQQRAEQLVADEQDTALLEPAAQDPLPVLLLGLRACIT